MKKLVFVALAACVATPVLAQSAPSTAIQPSANSQKGDLDRIVCEREEQIGSRLGARKVCKTVREWQEQRRIPRADFEKVQQVVNQSPGG